MSLITVFRLILFMGILPMACGAYPAMFGNGKTYGTSWVKTYVYGWLVIFAVFEALCVPFVITLRKFSEFTKVFQVCIFVIAALSAVLAVRTYGRRAGAGGKKERRREGALAEQKAETAEKPERKKDWAAGGLWLLVILLVLVQMVYLYFYGHMDGDDSYYIAESVITDYFDTMFQRDAYTGMPMGLDVRHALSVTPMFVTWLGRVCGLHPAVMAHSILAPAWIGLMYLVYTMIGRELFAKNKKYVPVFVLLVNIWYIWGNISIYTAETFMYTRTWQGKALFANIIVPLAVCFLYEMLYKRQKISWIMLFILSIAGIFVTTAALYLIPLVYGIAGLWLLIREKKIRPCCYLILCCIPSLVYGAVYCYLVVVWR